MAGIADSESEIKAARSFLCPTSTAPIGLHVRRARGSFIYTQEGRTYLDFISGIGVANIGHAHPEVISAICRQAKQYLHVMVYGEYVQTPQVTLAARLAKLLPNPLSMVYFTNSGTEANEGALKVAKKFTGRKKLISFDGSFHGDTHGSCSVTGRAIYRQPFQPLLPGVSFLPFGETRFLKKIDTSVAAVIVEPVQAEGGIRVPRPDFLPALRARCREVGALLIFDEAQTGFGRTGKLFAMEHAPGVVPDIVTLAKALGGGMPLGAFVGSRRIMKTLSYAPPLSHVTTFGGHPVSCAAALASLEIILRENLADRAAQMGETLQAALRALAHTAPAIVEVRGLGMMIGMEFANQKITARFVKRARHAGLLLGFTLHSDRVVRIAPPLTLSESEMAQGLYLIKKSLRF